MPLGDDGSLVLTFPAPIADGAGPDFAVFENAFSTEFLELAFVEVSSDGTNFTRFPAHARPHPLQQWQRTQPMAPACQQLAASYARRDAHR